MGFDIPSCRGGASIGYILVVPSTGARLDVVGIRHVLQRVSRTLTLHTCAEKPIMLRREHVPASDC